ncbi:MAG: glucosaminidase domain-containing protein [Bacteroidales bacterium]|nr:glucosaminidase domain-containing protein [Bacteroidales bacterium]
MKKIFTLAAALCLVSIGFAQYTMEDRIYDYIDDYKDLAMQEMELYGIPASITLAQAIYASQAGTNDLVRECHNHFAIMCHTQEWKGETYYRPADKNHENCYRKYDTDADSYRDHSLFLSTRSRYVKLFYFPITDYKSWANGLLEAGFSGNPKYADTLVSIIEKYYLMHYDRKVAQKLGDTTALRAMDKPHPERTGTTPTTPVAAKPAVQQPEPAPAPKTEVTKPVEQPKAEPVAQKPVEPAKTEAPKAAVKRDTMEVNGIEVIVEKPEKKKAEPQPQQPKQEPQQPKQEPKQTQPQQQETAQTQLPEKVNGLNVFVLDPYTVPYKSAYYPYTSRPVYENNKTKFILARAGDTYQKLANALQLTEKNLRLYNDVYDGSEPIEDEVIYLEQKSTKSTIPYHTLQEGDTYRYIAQRYGIQLKILIKRNSGNINSYGVGDQICIGCN